MKKILMFGGTFNPVHNGHVRLCRTLAERIGADLTVIIPTYSPVHKKTGDGNWNKPITCYILFF